MIKLTLKKYLDEKEKYADISTKNIWVRLKKNPNISFNILHLPDTFSDVNGKKVVIPKYYTDVNMFLDRFLQDEPYVENFEVELDTNMINITLDNEGPNKYGEYINMDEYVLSDKMHWFNQEVLKFYKEIHTQRVVLTSDITKTRSLFKNKVCSDDGKPIEYRMLLRLFDMTGVSDESFKNFIKSGGK